MSRPLERLESEALELTAEDRATLAHRLIASLDGEVADLTEVELEWEEEIRHRLEEYHRGDVQVVSSVDVFAKARALLM